MELIGADPVDESMVNVFLEALSSGTLDVTRLPQELSVDDGFRAQIEVLKRRVAAGETLSGWKSGFTSGVGRDRIGAGVRPFGNVVDSRVVVSGGSVQLTDLRPGGLEAEIAIEIGAHLTGMDLSIEQIRAAVVGARPAFELVQKRAPRGCATGIAIADNLSQWGIVLGELRDWSDDFAPEHAEVRVRRDGGEVGVAGPGYAIDHPFLAISRLCRSLHRVGWGLQPGQVVITGAFFKTDVTEPATWSAEFGGLGEVQVEVR